MSAVDVTERPATPRPPVPGWMLVLFAWLVMMALVGGLSPFRGEGWPAITGDDAWRMAEVADLVSGQGWFDTVQHRDNTPYGTPMHWSRLIDAPLAGLTLAFRPLYGAHAAEAAASLWPLLLLAVFLSLVVLLADRMAGKGARLPALLVVLLATVTSDEFSPGRVDHHNVQMVLTLAAMLTTVSGRTGRGSAFLAGLLAATGIAIGTESLPVVLAALVLFPLYWIFAPERSRSPVLVFAGAFALSLVGHLAFAVAPAAYFNPACDQISLVYVVAGFAYAAAVSVVVFAGGRLTTPWARLVAMGVAGAGAVAVVVLLFPECRGGPYAQYDPELNRILLTDFSEAMPIWTWLTRAVGGGAGLVLLPLVGLLGALVAAKVERGEARLDWLAIAVFAAFLVLVTALQVRGLRLAILPAIPAGGWAILMLWRRLRAAPGPWRAVPLAAATMGFAGAAHVLAVYAFLPGVPKVQSAAGQANVLCAAAEPYGFLATLPPGRVMNYIFMGPQVLFYTPHAIVSAGYHRDEQGSHASLDFLASEDSARRIVAERRLDYLVKCRGVPMEYGLDGVAPFAGIVDDVPRWTWLRRLSNPDDPVQIFGIDPSMH